MSVRFALLLILLGPLAGGAAQTMEIQDILIVVNQGRGTTEGRAAWERLSQADPDTLPHLLAAMDTQDIVVCNWLRTAFDRIVEREMKTGGKAIDVDAL